MTLLKFIDLLNKLPEAENVMTEYERIKSNEIKFKVAPQYTDTIILSLAVTTVHNNTADEHTLKTMKKLFLKYILYVSEANSDIDNERVEHNIGSFIDFFIKYGYEDVLLIIIQDNDNEKILHSYNVYRRKLALLYDVFLMIKKDLYSAVHICCYDKFDVYKDIYELSKIAQETKNEEACYEIFKRLLCTIPNDEKAVSCQSSLFRNWMTTTEKEFRNLSFKLIKSVTVNYRDLDKAVDLCVKKCVQSNDELIFTKNYLFALYLINLKLDLYLNINNLEIEKLELTESDENIIYNHYKHNFYSIYSKVFEYVELLQDEKHISIDKSLQFVNYGLNITRTVKNIRNALKINDEEQLDNLYYYTGLGRLRHILPQKTDNGYKLDGLKLMHIAYMNDPEEGKTLQEALYVVCEKYNDNIVDDIPYVFIKCFSRLNDYLPMWKMYGDECCGCCLNIKWISDKYKLYNVCYLEKCDSSVQLHVKSQYNPNLTKVTINKLNKELESLNSVLEVMYEYDDIIDVPFYLPKFLDEIRFLFKEASYSYENEVRCVVEVDNGNTEIEFLGEGTIPRLGISCGDAFEINSVMLGPKIVNYEEVVPYLQYQLNLIGKLKGYSIPYVELSEIKYR